MYGFYATRMVRKFNWSSYLQQFRTFSILIRGTKMYDVFIAYSRT